MQVKILGSLLGFSRGEDIFSSEKQQHPIFWDQALDLMAEPMTPVAMELRASPKAPRLTLSWRGRFWSKCYILVFLFISVMVLSMYLVALVEEGSVSSTGGLAWAVNHLSIIGRLPFLIR